MKKEDNHEVKKMYPLAVRVKSDILDSYNDALSYLRDYRKFRKNKTYAQSFLEDFCNEVVVLYQLTKDRIKNTENPKEFTSLKNLDKYIGGIEIYPQTLHNFLKYFNLLQKLIYELGITEAEISPEKEEPEAWI